MDLKGGSFESGSGRLYAAPYLALGNDACNCPSQKLTPPPPPFQIFIPFVYNRKVFM
jgi:hypothetical protein